jgi:transcriptional regulator with XRE-family HTH domain
MSTNGYNNRLIHWRFESLGLSVREVARRAGVDATVVAGAINGKNITTRKLKLLCSALGLDRSYVVAENLKDKDFKFAVLNGVGPRSGGSDRG